MKRHTLAVLTSSVLMLMVILPAAISAQSNAVYRLQGNEEFVYGRIGLNDDGSQRFTFLVVRTPNPDKTIYRREDESYVGVRSIGRGGSMSVDRDVQDFDRYDYFIVFNGNKLGPFDRFKEVKHDNPNVADWISPGGQGLTFSAVEGQHYRLYANSRPQTSYWSYSQTPLVAEAPGKVAFVVQFDRNNWHLRENHRLIKQEYAGIWNLEYSADGSKLMYVGAPERTNERHVYINHERVGGPYTSVLPYVTGFVDNTNTPYFVGSTSSGQEVVVGTRRVNLPRNIRNIGRVYSDSGRLAFSGQDGDRRFSYLYTVSNNTLLEREGRLVGRGLIIANNRAYLNIIESNDNRTLIDQNNNVVFSMPLRELHDTLSSVRADASPTGDIYITYRRADGQGVVLKNGNPYEPAGSDFSRLIHISFNPVTGLPQIGLDISTDDSGNVRRIIHNDKAFDTVGEMDNFERYSVFPPEGPAYWIRRRIHAHRDWRWTVFRENEQVSEEFHHLFALTVSNDGTRFAALVSDDPDADIRDYYSTNRSMHTPVTLMVDGRLINGRFGAPVWSPRDGRFLALTQDGRNIIIRRL
ncbi:hypothetical protein SAMN05920897_106144 [Alkalispirochaeta americana]|uniref:WD40-like Beta Propeller Repeat n=2 Tax=Alkalispirochaeta americana TaxID=159291 RepID=A0A1N6RK67_9SPIO|nr:hypothetical protein SAMN05920897_106144 [Alkalispirochaeta americana]